jgi:cysteine synthase A
MQASVLDAIGNTPLVPVRIAGEDQAEICAKLEFLNPSGSIKDRMALHMANVAEREGLLRPGSTIVEATSGNTGISFAMLAAARGYKMVVVMPEHMTEERRALIRGYGAEIVLTPSAELYQGALSRARQLAAENAGWWMPDQFTNPTNVDAHRLYTGREIVEQTGGRVDAVVAGVGTGGTLIGIAQALRAENDKVYVVAVEPTECCVLAGGQPGLHEIQGIGAGFIPDIVDTSLIDEVITVPSNDAIAMAKRLARELGLLVGISSGANVLASLQVAERLGPGKRIVTVLADRAERYGSLGLLGE